jgi:hypothetical protein
VLSWLPPLITTLIQPAAGAGRCLVADADVRVILADRDECCAVPRVMDGRVWTAIQGQALTSAALRGIALADMRDTAGTADEGVVALVAACRRKQEPLGLVLVHDIAIPIESAVARAMVRSRGGHMVACGLKNGMLAVLPDPAAAVEVALSLGLVEMDATDQSIMVPVVLAGSIAPESVLVSVQRGVEPRLHGGSDGALCALLSRWESIAANAVRRLLRSERRQHAMFRCALDADTLTDDSDALAGDMAAASAGNVCAHTNVSLGPVGDVWLDLVRDGDHPLGAGARPTVDAEVTAVTSARAAQHWRFLPLQATAHVVGIFITRSPKIAPDSLLAAVSRRALNLSIDATAADARSMIEAMTLLASIVCGSKTAVFDAAGRTPGFAADNTIAFFVALPDAGVVASRAALLLEALGWIVAVLGDEAATEYRCGITPEAVSMTPHETCFAPTGLPAFEYASATCRGLWAATRGRPADSWTAPHAMVPAVTATSGDLREQIFALLKQSSEGAWLEALLLRSAARCDRTQYSKPFRGDAVTTVRIALKGLAVPPTPKYGPVGYPMAAPTPLLATTDVFVVVGFRHGNATAHLPALHELLKASVFFVGGSDLETFWVVLPSASDASLVDRMVVELLKTMPHLAAAVHAAPGPLVPLSGAKLAHSAAYATVVSLLTACPSGRFVACTGAVAAVPGLTPTDPSDNLHAMGQFQPLQSSLLPAVDVVSNREVLGAANAAAPTTMAHHATLVFPHRHAGFAAAAPPRIPRGTPHHVCVVFLYANSVTAELLQKLDGAFIQTSASGMTNQNGVHMLAVACAVLPKDVEMIAALRKALGHALVGAAVSASPEAVTVTGSVGGGFRLRHWLVEALADSDTRVRLAANCSGAVSWVELAAPRHPVALFEGDVLGLTPGGVITSCGRDMPASMGHRVKLDHIVGGFCHVVAARVYDRDHMDDESAALLRAVLGGAAAAHGGMSIGTAEEERRGRCCFAFQSAGAALSFALDSVDETIGAPWSAALLKVPCFETVFSDATIFGSRGRLSGFIDHAVELFRGPRVGYCVAPALLPCRASSLASYDNLAAAFTVAADRVPPGTVVMPTALLNAVPPRLMENVTAAPSGFTVLRGEPVEVSGLLRGRQHDVAMSAGDSRRETSATMTAQVPPPFNMCRDAVIAALVLPGRIAPRARGAAVSLGGAEAALPAILDAHVVMCCAFADAKAAALWVACCSQYASVGGIFRGTVNVDSVTCTAFYAGLLGGSGGKGGAVLSALGGAMHHAVLTVTDALLRGGPLSDLSRSGGAGAATRPFFVGADLIAPLLDAMPVYARPRFPLRVIEPLAAALPNGAAPTMLCSVPSVEPATALDPPGVEHAQAVLLHVRALHPATTAAVLFAPLWDAGWLGTDDGAGDVLRETCLVAVLTDVHATALEKLSARRLLQPTAITGGTTMTIFACPDDVAAVDLWLALRDMDGTSRAVVVRGNVHPCCANGTVFWSGAAMGRVGALLATLDSAVAVFERVSVASLPELAHLVVTAHETDNGATTRITAAPSVATLPPVMTVDSALWHKDVFALTQQRVSFYLTAVVESASAPTAAAAASHIVRMAAAAGAGCFLCQPACCGIALHMTAADGDALQRLLASAVLFCKDIAVGLQVAVEEVAAYSAVAWDYSSTHGTFVPRGVNMELSSPLRPSAPAPDDIDTPSTHLHFSTQTARSLTLVSTMHHVSELVNPAISTRTPRRGEKRSASPSAGDGTHDVQQEWSALHSATSRAMPSPLFAPSAECVEEPPVRETAAAVVMRHIADSMAAGVPREAASEVQAVPAEAAAAALHPVADVPLVAIMDADALQRIATGSDAAAVADADDVAALPDSEEPAPLTAFADPFGEAGAPIDSSFMVPGASFSGAFATPNEAMGSSRADRSDFSPSASLVTPRKCRGPPTPGSSGIFGMRTAGAFIEPTIVHSDEADQVADPPSSAVDTFAPTAAFSSPSQHKPPLPTARPSSAPSSTTTRAEQTGDGVEVATQTEGVFQLKHGAPAPRAFASTSPDDDVADPSAGQPAVLQTPPRPPPRVAAGSTPRTGPSGFRPHTAGTSSSRRRVAAVAMASPMRPGSHDGDVFSLAAAPSPCRGSWPTAVTVSPAAPAEKQSANGGRPFLWKPAPPDPSA